MLDYKLDQVTIKDWIVMLPLAGSILALTYDVGFFYGIGLPYFTLFSLSEHILFALQVLPQAITAFLIVPIGVMSYRLGYRHSQQVTPPIPGGETDITKLKSIQVEVQRHYRKSQRSLLTSSLVFVALGAFGALYAQAIYFAATVMFIGLSGVGAFFWRGASPVTCSPICPRS